jgi:hypothetical protein
MEISYMLRGNQILSAKQIDVVRAGAIVAQLTAASYAIERCEERVTPQE